MERPSDKSSLEAARSTSESRAPKIKILPERIVSLIAAGEVIDRPAAVVKELVENSIDGNADQIEVRVKGKDHISVFDNGEGMVEEDAMLCVQKHATSKISKEEDLNSITTFGFRGEALHSIAAVSKLILRTRPKDRELGTEVFVEGGRIKSVRRIYMEAGTHVIVKELFFNVPARKKFLSSDHVEFSYILDVITRYALAFPHIGVRLLRDGEVVLNLKRERNLDETIKTIFGDVKKYDLEISFQVGDITIEGFIWREKSKIGKWLFVNRRYVRDKTIFSAISRFDFLKNADYIIFVSAPPETYDVNVNPTKTEIRWRSPAKIREMVIAAIEEATRLRYQKKTVEDILTYTKDFERLEEKLETPQEVQRPAEPKVQKILEPKGNLKVLTVIDGIISIVELNGEIYFVDLHAYHEGKCFRELKEKFAAKIEKSEVLRFAIPLEVKLPKNIILKILERKEDFERIGVNLSADIENSKAVVFSIPYYLYGLELSDFLTEFADGFESKKLDDFLAAISCRTVMRKGDRLQIWDAIQILQDFDPKQRCPHGRPAVIKLDLEELKSKFGRC